MTNSTTGQIDFNHWLLRLIAYIIDTLIVGIIVGIIISFTFSAISSTYSYFWFGPTFYIFTLPLIIGIIEVPFFIIFEIFFGATLGKRILGFEVQMKNGRKITAYKSLIRNITKIYWPILLIDWLIAVLTQGFDKRQKYSDRFAGTAIILVRLPFTS